MLACRRKLRVWLLFDGIHPNDLLGDVVLLYVLLRPSRAGLAFPILQLQLLQEAQVFWRNLWKNEPRLFTVRFQILRILAVE